MQRACYRCAFTSRNLIPLEIHRIRACGIASAFQPSVVDKKWSKVYQAEGCCEGLESVENVFSMVLPPPNVTGSLHLGHALTVAIQDAVVRWNKMHGKKVVWVPGCDHAGIATQAVVERHLLATEKVLRADMKREEFVSRVFDWKNENEDRIYTQLQRLGPLMDWKRKVFTLDPGMNESVNEAFIRLYNDGLIYRKSSLTYWCVALQTSLSDIEVDHVQVDSPRIFQFPSGDKKKSVVIGMIYDLAYKVVDTDDELVFSTTRPETVFGDVALAVHPDDGRYTKFIGKHVIQPLTRRMIPVIADAAVDKNFGTGVVKITPAHDTTDFDIGERHGLEAVKVIDWNGKMVNVPEQFQGLSRFEGRSAVLEEFRNLGLLRGERSHRTSIPVCSRSGDLLELMLRPQWFVNCKPLAEEAIRLVEQGQLKFVPEYHKAAWFEFLRNIKDWCVSRQLWWGHRVPMYRAKSGLENDWFPARNVEEAQLIAKQKYHSDDVVQDEDVLDTWFSSGLFPFAVFGWPKKMKDLETFFPLSLMETGSDILFFWVARMVMMSCYLTGKTPFREVLLHGMICDSEGKKMSKSKGNVIDPLDVINGITKEEMELKVTDSCKNGIISKEELSQALTGIRNNFPNGIKEIGSDGLRLALCSHDIKNDIIKVNLDHIVSHRLFLNKPWQAARFLFMNLDKLTPPTEPIGSDVTDPVNRWILGRMHDMLAKVESSFEAYDLHLVTKAIIQFLYFEFCDVFVEYTKPVLSSGGKPAFEAVSVLVRCLDVGLRALAPFTPFFSDELYVELHRTLREKGYRFGGLPEFQRATVADYPSSVQWSTYVDPDLKAAMEFALEVTRSIRTIKTQYGATKSKPTVIVRVPSDDERNLEQLYSVLVTLGRVESLTVSRDSEVSAEKGYAQASLSGGGTVYIDLQEMVNFEEEKLKLEKKLKKLTDYLTTFEKALESRKDLKKLKITRETCLEKARNTKREINQIEDQLLKLRNVLEIDR